MKINVSLSTKSIEDAIRKLQTAKDNLEYGLEQTLEILAKDGAIEANSAYGGMAKASDEKDSRFSTRINVTGDAVYIAEFGAGYATMEYHPFAKNAGVPIEVASFSRENYNRSRYGGLFYITNDLYPGEGYWIFGGQYYDRVQARHGLLNANDYIVENAGRIASEVIKL